ncbi:MAG: LPS-assembly protein LptD, partial [Desulfobacula sp.]|nr:LPS-assembly protein LptD [Desulfobacula sp.]
MFCLLRQRYLPLFVVFAFFYIFISTGGVAKANALPQNPKEIPWHISARVVTFDNKRNLYIAEDDVVITGGKTRLEADYVEFSNKTKDAFAQGNVILISGEDSISCNAMNINLITEIGTINKGTIFIQKNNFYINGENIRKTGKFTYSADKGTITSCPGESPDWKISGKNVKVTVEGYGTARDAIFWIKKVPSAYTPFLMFPVKTKRQTGLLVPRISRSDRKGSEYEQPLFIAISKNTDATFYADHMSDRGTKIGAEYRYILDNKTKGSVFFDYLKDKTIDDGTVDTENHSFSSTPQR